MPDRECATCGEDYGLCPCDLTPEHVIEVVHWMSNARGSTYAARCTCGWLGATRGASERAALDEGAAHAGLTGPA